MTSTCTIENNITIMTVDLSSYPSLVKQPLLPPSSNQSGRIISFKALPDTNASAYTTITVNFGDSIDGASSNNLYPSYAMEVQASVAGAVTSNNIPVGWAILKRYPDLLSTYGVSNITNATVVSLPTNQSIFFVNLLNESKALVLPTINSISGGLNTCFTYTIKDINGNAAISSMYLSTSGGATIDSNNTILKIDDNFACVDLTTNPQLNQWMITGYYGQI